MSPFLFALATLPLLDFLKFLLDLGCLHSQAISVNLTVYYKLFADGMEMFIPVIEVSFQEARDAISIYKRASGESLMWPSPWSFLLGCW